MPRLITSAGPQPAGFTPAESGPQGPQSACGWCLPRANPLLLLPLEWLLRPPALEELQLSQQGLAGLEPLPWWAAGWYADGLRRRLLALRRNPRSQNLRPLLPGLVSQLRRLPRGGPAVRPPVLMAIPSWKRQANPLPPLLAAVLSQQLGWPQRRLLERSRPVLGQHRLGRDLRWQNQLGAFKCVQPPTTAQRRVVLLDDILTTGATACAAAAALREGGWRVLGMACVGRTPAASGHRPG
ncbi:MAG: ComF family protein [Prochlorococcaceae cyanobacterium]